MNTKDDLIKTYINIVKEKDKLLEKQHQKLLHGEEAQKLTYLYCKLNELVGKMIEVGLFEVEIQEE